MIKPTLRIKNRAADMLRRAEARYQKACKGTEEEGKDAILDVLVLWIATQAIADAMQAEIDAQKGEKPND